MACHLKTVALSLNVLALILLIIGISVPYFITNYSIWDLENSLQKSGFCQPSKIPETDSGGLCLFPFMSGVSTTLYYDCVRSPIIGTPTSLWCATSCNSNGYQTAWTNCKRTRASTADGIADIQAIGIRNIDLARTVQAVLLLAVFVLASCAIMNALEYFSDFCAGNEAMEIVTIIFYLLAPVLILIGLAIPTSSISGLDQIGWAFWLTLTAAVIGGAAAVCYIIGCQGDRYARSMFPLRMKSQNGPSSSVAFIPSHGPELRHRTRPYTPSSFPSRWVRVMPKKPPRENPKKMVEWQYQGGYPYPYKL